MFSMFVIEESKNYNHFTRIKITRLPEMNLQKFLSKKYEPYVTLTPET